MWEEVIAEPHVKVLHNQMRILEGKNIWGGTLWTDFNKGHPLVLYDAKRVMMDYRYMLTDRKTKATPSDVETIHLCQRRDLQMYIDAFSPELIVTHHAPSYRSVHPMYRGAGDMNYYFYSDLDTLVQSSGAKFWAHGHMHNSASYTIGDTRVISNPRGYSGHDQNPDYDPQLVLEL